MAPTAYVFLSTNPEKTDDVVNGIKNKKFLIDGYKISDGQYDMLIKVYGESFSEIGENVINDIRSVPGIIKTKTFLCMNF